MDERFDKLQKTKSLIGHERETVRCALRVCDLITRKWDHPSSQISFELHDAMAELLVAMNVQLTKDGGIEQTNKLYNEIVDIRFNRLGDRGYL